MKKVLVTGASGLIGSIVRDQLADRYELSYLTRTPAEFDSHVADITDLEAIQPAFEGVEAVVHLAASPAVTTPWDDVLNNNIIGTYNVYEAARRAGVDAMVYASSNHAVGLFEASEGAGLYALDDPRQIDEHSPVRPDSYYGVSKVFGEAMGRYYSEAFGMRVFCLRIGSVRRDNTARPDTLADERPVWLDLTDEQVYERLRATWFSHRDCAQLIGCCLDADHVQFGIYYGVSNNPRQIWDLTKAREELGFEPQDSAPIS